MWTKRKKMRGGFTLVEILTTMAIIGILLSVLLPALNQVGKSAANVKQKAQFHTIEMALETFRADTGDYPPSRWDTATYGSYSASQRLAEAIIGRDGFGFHPASQYRVDGKGDVDNDGTLDPLAANRMIYDVVNGVPCSSVNQSAQENLATRKGPYLELENANAVNLGDYSQNFSLANPVLPSFVLADSFRTAKLKSGRKTGIPILYYKANRLKTRHTWAAGDTVITITANNTYNVYDSISGIIADFGMPNPHPLFNDPAWFYQRTTNPNFANPARPYRAESFILQSAGADGLYGTSDDVFNFDEGK